MARNQEKAQSMLFRFREQQMVDLGIIKDPKQRATFAHDVHTVPECEQARYDLIGALGRKISKIHNTNLDEQQIRDLNDEINRLLKKKESWEIRIRELGGSDYRKSAVKQVEAEGIQVPGSGAGGYKYFGRAKDLPGVRELFDTQPSEPPQKSRADLYRQVDIDYYGYREGLVDEAEKELEQLEAKVEDDLHKGVRNRNPFAHNKTLYMDSVPTQKQVETFLVQRRQQQLLEKYVGET